MGLQFSEKKATQAAALFLSLSDRKLNYMVLVKDLYLTDRRALACWGRSVTNDRFYSMKLGPVLSHVLDLINEQPMPDESRYWSKFISPPSDYHVTLKEDPGTGQLSTAEEELIKATFKEYRSYQVRPFEFAKFLHSSLPEWEHLNGGRSPITIRSILLAAQKSTDEINEIENDLSGVSFVHSRFSAED